MDRHSPSDAFRITLSGKPIKSMLGGEKVKLRFGPMEGEQELYFVAGTIGKDTPSLIMSSTTTIAARSEEDEKQYEAKIKSKDFSYSITPPVDSARNAAVQYLSIRRSSDKVIILETGPLAKPLATLSKCMEDTAATWGINIARHATISKWVTPLKSPATWITSNDYPQDMLSKGQGSIVNFRLSVDEKGVPSACHIQPTFREKAFDDIVCKAIMRKARFKPALDKDGVPMASYYLNIVRFQIPRLG